MTFARHFLISLLVACAVPPADSAPQPSTAEVARRVCPDLPEIPSTLAPPVDTAAVFALEAHGVQRYACAGSPAAGYAWAFVAPDADLYTQGVHTRLSVHHTAGPSWRASDGSAVVAALAARETPDPTAIPWLLLRVTSASGDPDGTMAPITWIQRVSTCAGLAPAAATCNADTVGKAVEQSYDALYVFYSEATPEARCAP